MFLGLETLGYKNSCGFQQGPLELSENPELPSKKVAVKWCLLGMLRLIIPVELSLLVTSPSSQLKAPDK